MEFQASAIDSSRTDDVTGAYIEWQPTPDTDGGMLGHVILMDSAGRTVGTVGMIKRDPQSMLFHGRPAEGGYWHIGPFSGHTQALGLVVDTFKASPHWKRVCKVLRDYRMGLITRTDRDLEVARNLFEYGDIAVTGRIPGE